MGKSSKKAAPPKKGAVNASLKKVNDPPTAKKKKSTKKKNQQIKDILKNDSQGTVHVQSRIDFSSYAAGSDTKKKPSGGASLVAIPEDQEEQDRVTTPIVDNRARVEPAQAAAQMTDAQKQSFHPTNQTFGDQDDTAAAQSEEDEQDSMQGSESGEDDPEAAAATEDDEEEEVEEEEDSKLPARDSKASNPPSTTVLEKESPPPQQTVAHNPYATYTPMEVDTVQQLSDLNAGPKDAIRPRTIFRKSLFRVDIKVTAKGSSQSDVELINGIKAIMVKLQEADKSIAVLPYLAVDSNLKPLVKFPDDVPSGISTLKKYFQNATPRMNGGSYFIRSLLFFNKEFADTTEDINWWLGEQKAGIWIRKVQKEKVTNIGYLLYSLRSMDVDRLTRTFSYRYGTKVGIRYRAISTGRRGKYDPSVELPRAIHLEVAEG